MCYYGNGVREGPLEVSTESLTYKQKACSVSSVKPRLAGDSNNISSLWLHAPNFFFFFFFFFVNEIIIRVSSGLPDKLVI